MSVFCDERGRTSGARVFLFGTLLVVWALAIFGADRAEIVWTTLTTIAIALVSWAAGPRVAQYLPSLLSGLRRPSLLDTGITPEDK